MATATWKVTSKRTASERELPLVAFWEVDGDPVSDDYTPDEISAEALFGRWVKLVEGQYPDDLVPIHWFVYSPQGGLFERMPFQFQHVKEPPAEDFLTNYLWPVHPKSGERLNWLTLPVADKLWQKGRADKGGFIQQATGWKPSVLQPTVYLPSLLSLFQ